MHGSLSLFPARSGQFSHVNTIIFELSSSLSPHTVCLIVPHAPLPPPQKNKNKKASRKRSPKPGKGGTAAAGIETVDGEPPSTELVGAAAEERGLWLAALRAAVSTVRCASRFVPAFVQDFESAGGYETVGYMVRRSSIDRLPAMLEQVSVCLSVRVCVLSMCRRFAVFVVDGAGECRSCAG